MSNLADSEKCESIQPVEIPTDPMVEAHSQNEQDGGAVDVASADNGDSSADPPVPKGGNRRWRWLLIAVMVAALLTAGVFVGIGVVRATRSNKTPGDATTELRNTSSKSIITNYLTQRPPYAGVWVNTKGRAYNYLNKNTHGWLAGEGDRLSWSEFESSPGVYDFTALERTLTRCRDRDYYYYAVIWTSSQTATPDWIYSSVGVPKVTTDSGKTHPFYLHQGYRTRVTRFFVALANFLASLPGDKRDRIAFLQPGFGSTGDKQLYKGMPVNSRYNIGADQYVEFMKSMTEAWVAAFDARHETRSIKFLWNIDQTDRGATYYESEKKYGERKYAEYMNENYDCQFRKQQFTIAIGYMAVNENVRDDDLRESFYGEPNKWGGNPEFVRGEHNGNKWGNTPMALQAPRWHYYWTAISSVDMGLDAWEVKPWEVETGDYNEACDFSARYSYYKRPETSPFAFVALRDVLDYSNIKRFPEARYGTAQSGNQARINQILKQYAAQGAQNEDTASVMNSQGAAYLLESQGMNDCVWNVIDRNYRRHMSQYNPGGTSVGRWRVGNSAIQPYGRFARAFDNASGKNAMYFTLDKGFFPPDQQQQGKKVTFTVIYFDEIANSRWELRYDAIGVGELKTAISVTGRGNGLWKTVSVTVGDAAMLSRGPNGSDLALINIDSLDDTFHLIEIEKQI